MFSIIIFALRCTLAKAGTRQTVQEYNDHYTVGAGSRSTFVRQRDIRDRGKNQFTRDRKPTIDKFKRERGCGRKMWSARWEKETRVAHRDRRKRTARGCMRGFSCNDDLEASGLLARTSRASPSIRSSRQILVRGISPRLLKLFDNTECRLVMTSA